MDRSYIERLAGLFGRVGSRRTALAATVAGGLGLAGAEAAFAQSGKAAGAEGNKRGKRGKNGKNGQNGQPGAPGAPAGAGAIVESQVCTLPADSTNDDVGDTELCTATCGAGFVAVGGGYLIPRFFESLGYVRGSYPNATSGAATGWVSEVEYLNVGQAFDVTTYVICAPAS